MLTYRSHTMTEKFEIQADNLAHRHPEVYGTERTMTLYYDETNNIRKLRLRENGLNVSKYDNFVLGGIVLLPGQTMSDIGELRKSLYIQPSAEEIKFELVASGAFEKMLDSKKLTKCLSWIFDQNIGIHYTNLNVLHWTILDIVESIVADDEFEDILPFQHELKNELYNIAITDLPTFLALLHSYSFPDVPRARTGDFIRDVRAFIRTNWPTAPNNATQLLDQVLAKATSLGELVFLVDETPGELIDGFDKFFLNRICTFNNARHVLDEEKEIQKAISPFRLMNGDREMDFTFVDSKKVPEIQISDVVVGFLGKYFAFIEKTPYSALIRIRQSLTSTQKKNLQLMRDLIKISDTISNNLLFRITTLDSNWKSDAFLFGTNPAPHLLKR